MRLRWIQRTICAVATVALLCLFTGPVLADSSSIVRSVLLPGSGQAHQGHYTKAAVFAGAAVVSGVGLILSQVHYNQSVIRFNDLNDLYAGYPALLDGGTIVPYSDITQTYDDMRTAYDQSEDRKTWRNVFLGAFIATYALNIVDIVLSERETGEKPPESSVGLQVDGGSVRVFKTFDF